MSQDSILFTHLKLWTPIDENFEWEDLKDDLEEG